MEKRKMNSAFSGKPDVLLREVAIVDFLREKSDGATLKEIYEEVSATLGDTISRPAYYKLLDRLVIAGKIDQVDDEVGARRYIILPQIHATNRLTLDDVYEMLPFVESTHSMARAVEAQEYFYEHRKTIMCETAMALAQEPAVNLFFRWIDDLLAMLRADLINYNAVETEGLHEGRAVLKDDSLELRLRNQCEILREILYRHLSIAHEAVHLPQWEGSNGLKHTGHFYYNPERLGEELEKRIFGVGEQETVLGLVSIDQPTLKSAAQARSK
jgi:Fe2+ or Zn2+ uptake regulation protein